jgi:L-fuculose-phosphate aldolase
MAITPADVLAAAQGLLARGLVTGAAGNVSGRLADGTICLTPSALAYETMSVDDLVTTDLDGRRRSCCRQPTSEQALHLACLRRHPEIGAVVHSHSPYATMFAVARQPVPAVIEEVVLHLGGDVVVCEHRPSGSEELGERAAAQLADRGACLLAHHGVVAVGRDPAEALHHAELVERTAMIVWGARLLGQPIEPLPEATVAAMAGEYRRRRRS